MVYEYAISFEIKADSTYTKRYNSLMDQIRQTPGNAMIWAETTSFVLLRSSEKIDVLAHRLYYDSELLDSKDMLLVIDHTASACVARGPFEYPNTLKSHFKGCDIK
jgi:hypothetical protein